MLKFWLTLVCIGGAIAVWFLSLAGMELWSYSRLGPVARAQVKEWHIIEKSPSAFGIQAEFVFEVRGQVYEGKTLFAKPYFLNIPSAESALKKLQTRQWTAWYNQKNPSICSLQKLFPFKACIQAFLTLAVFVYFWFLRGFIIRLAV